MVAAVANFGAWCGCALLLFFLLKDFIAVERESKLLERQNAEERGERRGGE